MDDRRFWDLIDLLDWSKTGDDDAVLAPLVKQLSSMSEDEIYAFDDALAAKLHALDGEAYAREIGDDAYEDGKHFSVDAFLYARCCVVVNGQAEFEKVLAEPTRMPKNMEFEAILYAAQRAFQEKTGKKYTHVPTPDYETYSNAKGWSQRD